MSRTFKGAVLLAAAVGLWQASAGANGGSAPAPPPSSGGSGSGMTAMTPEELAIEAFKSGDGHRLKGRKLEEESVTKKGADVQKSEVKARGEFEKSLKDFQKAAKLNPQLFQAYNGMGYAYRKTGRLRQGARDVRPGDQAWRRGFFRKRSNIAPRPISR